jgi:hypothetical protein
VNHLQDAFRTKVDKGEKSKSGITWRTFLLFSLALIIVPLVVYRATLNILFEGKIVNCLILIQLGNALFAGVASIISLNVVLISFVALAAYEEYIENK